MSADWERVEEIFHAVLEQPVENRTAFLRERCGEDNGLADEVESMLRTHRAANEFLEQPALEVHAETLAREDESTLSVGTSLGVYRIVALLGVGGMGEVYLAQNTELGREVAIKLIHPSFGRAGVARHLRQEARILASLNDPHIARLYGVAATAEGVPYFIMEYVEGERLDDYCRRRSLTTNERLELFRKVCSAVASAHRHLIIHRDLKPANIRLTPEGEPKLLDFGIAKLLDPDSTTALDQTMTLAGAMTPDYASPEQARGETMTTASDIYSLGVILYELLTGKKPYRLTNRHPHEIARALAETTPARPSQHRRELAGELDNILLMALRKEPERRYSSVGQFSEDLRRHLAGLPVLAHKDTATYRAQKFVRRHRGAVAAAGLAILALFAGLVVATWQARVARLAQSKAEASRTQADHLNQFLEDLLASADPAKMGKDGKVVPILDAASERLDREMAGEPEFLARAHDTLRRAYQHLGLYEQAEQHARAALDLVRRLHSPNESTTARAEFSLADVLTDRYHFKEAEPLLRDALAVQRRQPARDHAALADTLMTLSFLYSAQERPREAEPLSEQALAEARSAWGDQDQRYARVLNETGTIKIAERNYPEAETIFRRLIVLQDKLQPGGLDSIAPQINLCIALFNQDKLSALAPVVDRLERDTRRLVGEHGLPFALALAVRSCLDFAQGDFAPAIPRLRQALETLTGSYPPGQTTVVQCRGLLGLCLTRTGHAAEGEPFLRAALADGGKVDRVEFNHTFGNLEIALGECLLAQKNYAEAEPLLRRGYDDLKARLGPQSRLTVEGADLLRKLSAESNKPAPVNL